MQIAFYSGKDCHLCELAKQIVKNHSDFNHLEITYFDVSADHQTYHLYGARIPVLKRLDNNKELGWPFDHVQFSEFLK